MILNKVQTKEGRGEIDLQRFARMVYRLFVADGWAGALKPFEQLFGKDSISVINRLTVTYESRVRMERYGERC